MGGDCVKTLQVNLDNVMESLEPFVIELNYWEK
jgi:hypothetical protein